MKDKSWSTSSPTTLYPSLVKSEKDLLRSLSVTLSTLSDNKATFSKQPSRSNLDGALQEWRLSGVQLGNPSKLDSPARLLTMDLDEVMMLPAGKTLPSSGSGQALSCNGN